MLSEIGANWRALSDAAAIATIISTPATPTEDGLPFADFAAAPALRRRRSSRRRDRGFFFPEYLR